MNPPWKLLEEVGFIVCLLIPLLTCQDSKKFNKSDILYRNSGSKCMGDLGCFAITDNFKNKERRPINVLPSDREKIGTQFSLYTRKNIKEADIIKANVNETIEKSYFNPAVETKMLVPGFLAEVLYTKWLGQMKDAFLMHGDYNVIVVDWVGGNGFPYFQAAANTRVVGAEIALLINYLQKNYGLKPDMVHILGHSLGAHIAGYAGERIQDLGRITAMDPAQAYFQYLPPSVRLDPTDASFVDVIHTNAKSSDHNGFGMSQLIGHVDFFPDDGNNHPGCNFEQDIQSIVTEGLHEGESRIFACDHQRSVDFMLDSINNNQCQMVAHVCADWKSFLLGECATCGTYGEKCAIMGLRSIEYQDINAFRGNPGKLFLQTADKSPYCTFQYRVAIQIKEGVGKKSRGKIIVILKGKRNIETFTFGKEDSTFEPGQNNVFVLNTQKELGEIEAAGIYWKTNDWFEKQTIYLDYMRVYPMAMERDDARKKKERTFCTQTSNPIKSEDVEYLITNC